MPIFEGIHFFRAMNNIKRNNSTDVWVLPEGCGENPNKTGELDSLSPNPGTVIIPHI